MSEERYLTVQALTKYIKRKFDYDPYLQDFYVKGEISNFKRHSSGHMYFTLKDEKARILAVMFAASAKKLRFEPENGMNVLLRGEITVYEPSGQYQIYVKEMQPDGIGGLYLAFEQLKEKLEKEGLFKKEYKKKLPPFPTMVGVITSPTGAAIRDIITTIKRRYPVAKIIVYPALVQGNQAGPSVVKAIQTANERNEADVLIVGRGGGSIEELWAFNEEIVARAIFESNIPIISAVGHETDTTVADFVADMRAPTPTGAAELAVPHIEDLMERVLNRKIRLLRVIKEKVNMENEKLSRLTKSYAFRYPHKMFEQKMEHLDRTMERSNRVMIKLIKDHSQQLQLLSKRLERNHPQAHFERAKTMYTNQEKRLNRLLENLLKDKQKQFVGIIQTLEALSPLKIMNRGYSIVYQDDEKLLKSVKDVAVGDKVNISLFDGKLHAQVLERRENDQNG
ncbi:exodeoxyribonuclease VII large subunit [Caldibacillus lycopersici]|uniref:Exodeoxyribonuclease 7 large subunit n=1 Tax=Perspicuibacillus lycopersici TaxID=1325689 RepID=A0AAE3IXG3_9BACI|nr:exodeoxyribonuclease VII large subunit [Perspicuibacillus lycopersici]MCU9613830.1 exodeoxyribonuclease VII large subunit [Perspicuibacillus lycopersici]